MDQETKAKAFAELHIKGSPILLYNAWNVGSAKAIVQAGAKAVATSSWAVAAALGYEDGEMVPKDIVEEVAGGVVEAVPVPVTVDFEGGYAEDGAGLTANGPKGTHYFKYGVYGTLGTASAQHQWRNVHLYRK